MICIWSLVNLRHGVKILSKCFYMNYNIINEIGQRYLTKQEEY